MLIADFASEDAQSVDVEQLVSEIHPMEPEKPYLLMVCVLGDGLQVGARVQIFLGMVKSIRNQDSQSFGNVANGGIHLSRRHS